jgi:DNA mismatch repair ATPase MutS
MSAENAITPMMKQYFNIKAENPGALIMFRLGDFYEYFGEDAQTAARELDIVLTGRDAGLNERMPMCGVPFHAIDQYLGRLIQKGYKVCVCEQLEDPKLVKGLVKRGVIRVVTPGTAMDTQERDESVYIAAVLNGLEDKGLITRRIDKNDRRKVVVSLTETGRAAEEAQRAEFIGHAAAMLAKLGDDDAKEFVRIIKKLMTMPPECGFNL